MGVVLSSTVHVASGPYNVCICDGQIVGHVGSVAYWITMPGRAPIKVSMGECFGCPYSWNWGMFLSGMCISVGNGTHTWGVCHGWHISGILLPGVIKPTPLPDQTSTKDYTHLLTCSAIKATKILATNKEKVKWCFCQIQTLSSELYISQSGEEVMGWPGNWSCIPPRDIPPL